MNYIHLNGVNDNVILNLQLDRPKTGRSAYTKKMIKIYSPNDEIELSMIRGLLDSEGIHFFVHNDHFGSMEVGPQIELFNKKAIMVAAEDVDRAKHIIADFLGSEIPEEDGISSHYSLGQKLRMILESLIFWWFIPGKKKRKKVWKH